MFQIYQQMTQKLPGKMEELYCVGVTKQLDKFLQWTYISGVIIISFKVILFLASKLSSL